MVGVEPVGQAPLLLTMQGTRGGGVKGVIQNPPQVLVWVQVEPVGHGEPGTMQLDRRGFETLCVVARLKDERMSRLRG